MVNTAFLVQHADRIKVALPRYDDDELRAYFLDAVALLALDDDEFSVAYSEADNPFAISDEMRAIEDALDAAFAAADIDTSAIENRYSYE